MADCDLLAGDVSGGVWPAKRRINGLSDHGAKHAGGARAVGRDAGHRYPVGLPLFDHE